MSKGNAGWMQTYTGKQFFPLDPDPLLIEVEDIANALSNLCRFCGHSKFFYSVAQHSVLVSMHVNRDIALEALMHDAAEAYTGDLIRPIKRSVMGWNDIETNIQKVICDALNLRFNVMCGKEVLHADNVVLANEKRDVMGNPPAEWASLPEPSEVRIKPMSSKRAKALFLKRFDELMVPSH